MICSPKRWCSCQKCHALEIQTRCSAVQETRERVQRYRPFRCRSRVQQLQSSLQLRKWQPNAQTRRPLPRRRCQSQLASRFRLALNRPAHGLCCHRCRQRHHSKPSCHRFFLRRLQQPCHQRTMTLKILIHRVLAHHQYLHRPGSRNPRFLRTHERVLQRHPNLIHLCHHRYLSHRSLHVCHR